MGLDKFYTKDKVAKQCVQFLYEICPEAKDQPCIEPSAGAGAFLPYLPAQTIAYDIAPEKPAPILLWEIHLLANVLV